MVDWVNKLTRRPMSDPYYRTCGILGWGRSVETNCASVDPNTTLYECNGILSSTVLSLFHTCPQGASPVAAGAAVDATGGAAAAQATWSTISNRTNEPKPQKAWIGWSDRGACNLQNNASNGKDPYCTCGRGAVPVSSSTGNFACKQPQADTIDIVNCPSGQTPTVWTNVWSKGFHCT